MRRELLIAAGVLVPFAVLVAAGFYFAPEPVAFVAPSTAKQEPEVKQQSPLPRGPRPWGRWNRGEEEGQGEGQKVVVVLDAGYPPELAAALSAVQAEVHQCFRDQRLKQPREIRIRFTPTRDGGFTNVDLKEQNPYLAACLEDVFAEVTWQPNGRETWAPAEHTFSFDPSSD